MSAMEVSLSEYNITNYVAKWMLPPPGSKFQVLGTKKLSGDETQLKYRVCVSDGIHRFSQAMIHLAKSDKEIPPENSVIQIRDESDRDPKEERPNTIHKISNKLVWIIGSYDIVARPDGRIGNPVPLDPNSIQENIPAEPTTPSSSANGVSSPPAGPSKRPPSEAASRDEEDESKAKLARRMLFPESPVKATQPISAVNCFSNKFTLKARVVKKSDVRTWHNSRGSGKVFDVILQDSSGEIKAVGFGDVADRLGKVFEENKVYFISQVKVKNSDPKFNPTKHAYELSLTSATEVTEVRHEQSRDVPQLEYNYTQISDLAPKKENDLVDVIGICSSISDLRSLTVRSTGREAKKIDVQLMDTSDTNIRATLWDKKAEELNSIENLVGKVIRLRQAKVSDFDGKSLNVGFQGIVEVDPQECPEAETLQGWWQRRQDNADGAGLSQGLSRSSSTSQQRPSQLLTLKEILSDFKIVNSSDPPRYNRVEAYVMEIKADTIMYPACPTCNKKVVDQGNETYKCHKCGQLRPDYTWRYLLRAAIADPTDYQWVTLFDDTAQKVFGRSAGDLRRLQDADQDAFRTEIQKVRYNLFEFGVKSTTEVYNDENRVRMNVTAVTPVQLHSDQVRMQRLRTEVQEMKKELRLL